MKTTKNFAEYIDEMLKADPKLRAEVDEERSLMRVAHQLAKMPTRSTAHMVDWEREEGIQQMLADLQELARRDGCIAAAWAVEFFRHRHDPGDCMETTIEGEPHDFTDERYFDEDLNVWMRRAT